MVRAIWIEVSPRERAILLNALSLMRTKVNSDQVDALKERIVQGKSHPNITVGVRGGQVEWVKGNPFPVRVLDYDNDYCDAPDVDEKGRSCRCSIEPADSTMV